MEMNFCRRCGKPLTNIERHIFKCEAGHILFANSSPAASLVLIDNQKQALIAIRALEPGKGKWDIPGGFLDEGETGEDALRREMQEELGLSPEAYTAPQYLLTYIDPYEYKNETIPVFSVMYWAYLKPEANIQPADDVAKTILISYQDAAMENMQFQSGVASLERLHLLGHL